MQLMQNFLLRLNVFPPFNGPMERRLAIYTTLALSKPLHPHGFVGLIIIPLLHLHVNPIIYSYQLVNP